MTAVTLTDGGMGQELLRRSKTPPTPLWSARVLIDEPALVRDLHADFIRAGARVITINSYAATPERPAAIDSALIGANRDRWIEEWTSIVLP